MFTKEEEDRLKGLTLEELQKEIEDKIKAILQDIAVFGEHKLGSKDN